jgi:hypothetical protein
MEFREAQIKVNTCFNCNSKMLSLGGGDQNTKNICQYQMHIDVFTLQIPTLLKCSVEYYKILNLGIMMPKYLIFVVSKRYAKM